MVLKIFSSSSRLGYVRLKTTLMKRSIFITPELLVRIEQNQRHSIGNEKVGIESANKKSPSPLDGATVEFWPKLRCLAPARPDFSTVPSSALVFWTIRKIGIKPKTRQNSQI